MKREGGGRCGLEVSRKPLNGRDGASFPPIPLSLVQASPRPGDPTRRCCPSVSNRRVFRFAELVSQVFRSGAVAQLARKISLDIFAAFRYDRLGGPVTSRLTRP